VEQNRALNVAIVGGGPGGKAIMDMLFAERLSQLRMKLIGVACTNPAAVGYRYAQEKGVHTTTDFRDLFRLKDLGMIIELTGNDEVASEIGRTKPDHVRFIDHVTARLFWDIFQIEEQRLKDQEQARMALERAAKEKETILDNLLEHVIHDDRDMKIVWANRAACESAELTREALIGRHCYEIWPKRDSLCPDCAVVKAMETGLPQEAEKTTPDGKTWRIRGYPERDEHDHIVGGIEVTLDITEHKRAEEALRESEERFQQVADHVQEWIWEVDADGLYTYSSPVVERILGYRPDELVGEKYFYDLFHPEDREEYKNKAFLGFAGKKPFRGFINRNLHKNGKTVWLSTSGIPMLDGRGNLLGYRGADTDITERKRVQEALIRAKENWENTFDAITDLVMLLDSEHRIIRVNKAVAASLKATKESIVGKKCYEVFHRQSHPIRQCPLVETMKTLKPQTVELADFEMGGTFICSTSPVLDREGKLAGYTHVLKDITESKRLEAQFQEAQRLEAVGTLAGGIAHDFNNLLMGIQGRASLIMMDMDSDHPHFAHVSGIEEAIKRGAHLTRQLLGFARGGKYEVRPTDLNDLIDKSSEMLGRAKKEIKIHRRYQKGTWTADVDRGQIEQVLVNLYVNAWQAMPEGGDLYLETKNVQLEERDARAFDVKPGNYVKISMTDTGMGMDEATRQRVFEPFFTTKELGVGTGLGLASAYGIIKNHGGIITVDSEPGQGARFNIYLPASDREIPRDKEPCTGVLKGKETVLLVDDEDMILQVGREMLMALGYTVIEAASGQVAVELYARNKDRIDMVILDLIMPDMGGGEVYDRLKEMKPDVKVLLASGYSRDGRADDIMGRGCNGFIQKPFDVKELSGKLREILEKS
jgi:PAS domain S-box-containing protein